MHGGHENSMDQLSEQGNLLWGIDNCSGVAGFVIQVHWMALDNNSKGQIKLKSRLASSKFSQKTNGQI